MENGDGELIHFLFCWAMSSAWKDHSTEHSRNPKKIRCNAFQVGQRQQEKQPPGAVARDSEGGAGS